MSLRNTVIPDKHTRQGSIFDTILTSAEKRTIQAAAPDPLELVNDNTPDGAWTEADVNAIRRAGNDRGYRVQSRAATDGNQKRRRIWISWEPKRYGKKHSQ